MAQPFSLQIDHVSKSFRLPHERANGIKQLVVGLHRQRGYEIQSVLKDISFNIPRGEFFGIVGRNGSGKSTLLKLLAQIYEPDMGTVHVNGSLTPFIELGVGFNPELTGRENVYLNGALLGFDRRQMDVIYDDIVEFAELEDFMDQKLKNYSSGMQVRLAFSIAIRAKSDILLIDEVLAVGDAAFQRKCYDYFMQLKQSDTTVILVTHDMGAVRQYCDRAIMIEAGEIVATGSPEDVAQAYQKLFSDEVPTEDVFEGDDAATTDLDAERWGSGELVLTKASTKVNQDSVKLSVSYKSKVDLPESVYGFTIKGPSGVVVMDGNTMRSRVATEPTKKGSVVSLSWEIPNVFAAGRHAVSLAACDMSTTNYYDWYNNAVAFNIIRDQPSGGVVDPPVTTSPIKVL